MRKIFLVAAMFAASVVVFVSCNKEKDEELIIGTWVFNSQTAEVDSNDSKTSDLIKRAMEHYSYTAGGTTYIFKEDGKLTLKFSNGSQTERTYQIKGNKLTQFEGEVTYTTEFKISGDYLKLYWDNTEYFKSEFPEAGVKKAMIVEDFRKK